MNSPFVWHELLTSDPAGALAFYGALFGWDTRDGIVVDGHRVAAARRSPIHPHWAPFVRVSDPAAAAEAAVAAGGRVAGRPSAPAGIVLVSPKGAPTVVTAEDGHDLFGWHFLESTDLAASAAWIEAIGSLRAPPGKGLVCGEQQVGSHLPGAHDRWLGHVIVADRVRTRARALELGGAVEQADVDASGHGTYDVLVDPQGASFCAFQAP